MAAAARVREVAYDLERRVRQELAFPAVVHFYTWLLQGTPLPHVLRSSGHQYRGFSTSGPSQIAPLRTARLNPCHRQ